MRSYFIIISLRLSILICTGLICTSCEADYDIDRYFEDDFNPRVVVNSIISPYEPITANLCWSKYYADTSDYKLVEFFDVELYENGSLIASQQCQDGLFLTNIYPQESKTYSLKITVPNYGEINATTSIPAYITSEIEYIKMLEADPDNSGFPYRFAHFRITKISSKDIVRAVWIMAEANYNIGGDYPLSTRRRSVYMYSDNIFIDKINARQDFWCSQAKESNISYNNFMRISYANFSKVTPVDFSIEATGRYEKEELNMIEQTDISITPTYTAVSMLTPSIDYDQYQVSIIESSYINPFGSGASSVYSNIENGLGIFAGYNSLVYNIDIKENQQ